MPRGRIRGPGRPRRGKHRRETACLTLPADQLQWLRKEAKRHGSSVSELCEQALRSYQRASLESQPISFVRFPLSREAVSAFCQRYHITSLALFGSILGDRFTPTSDIDVLVDFDPLHRPSLFELATMEEELSHLLGGRTIDVKTAADLSPHFRTEVMHEAQTLYAA